MLIQMLSDVLALEITAFALFLLRNFWGQGDISPDIYGSVVLLLLIGPLFSVALNTCQSITLPPHKEIKQISLAVSLTYLIILAFLFLRQEGSLYSRLVVGGAWLCSLFTVPFLRGQVRQWLSTKAWWGRPVIFLRYGACSDKVWDYLQNHPQRGLKPVERLHITPDMPDADALLLAAQKRHPGAVGLFCYSEEEPGTARLIQRLSLHFHALLLVPELTTGEHHFWLTPRDLGCTVGLLVRQNLLDARRLRVKRCMDVALTIVGALAALPLGLLIALAIKLDSPGPALYAQRRLGQGGRPIEVYKFRTMVNNADEMLTSHLQTHPELCQEWEKYQKLRHDPRVTRVGNFLRKTSLDELPQLWNVFRGSMSLVGPRPIVESEIDRYGRVYMAYSLVKPGITGLWQVSGRNNTSYIERVRLDHYYVNNWSVWMDIWILARTIPVVLLGKGAY